MSFIDPSNKIAYRDYKRPDDYSFHEQSSGLLFEKTYEMSMITESPIEMIINFMRIEDQRNEMELIPCGL